MNFKSRKVILFDLFHTLASVWLAKAPGEHASAILGVSREEWNDQLLRQSPRRLSGKVTDMYEIYGGMARVLRPDLPDDVVRKAAESRRDRFAYCLEHVDEPTVKALRDLKATGRKLGLVSNADVIEVAAWDRSPMAPVFDTAVFSCHVGFSKPDPKIYQITCERLGVVPDDCIFVGDGGSDEIPSAKSLGMATALVTREIKERWPKDLMRRREYADVEIEEIAELVGMLQG